MFKSPFSLGWGSEAVRAQSPLRVKVVKTPCGIYEKAGKPNSGLGMSSNPRSLSDQSVSTLEVHPRVHSALKKAGLHKLRAVLVLSEGDLARRTGLSQSDVHSLVLAASKALLVNTANTTTLQLQQQESKLPNKGRLSAGCPVLDGWLQGGLLVPGVTEIAGSSAAGKTQLCLQLSLTVQLPRQSGGLEAGAVYLCTEDAFPNKRLQQLAEGFSRRSCCREAGLTTSKLTNSIFVEHAATISSFSMQLQYKLPSLLAQHRVRLVIVDSIAALFRAEFAGSQAVERAYLLRAFGAQLRRISDEYSAAVVCVNQVTAAMESGEGGGGVKPALGLAWADVVTTRFMLYRQEGLDDQDYQQTVAPVLREMRVLLSPNLPPSSLSYYIDSTGVHGVASIDSTGVHGVASIPAGQDISNCP